MSAGVLDVAERAGCAAGRGAGGRPLTVLVEAAVLNRAHATGVQRKFRALFRALARQEPRVRLVLCYPALRRAEDCFVPLPEPNIRAWRLPVPPGLRHDRFLRLWLDVVVPAAAVWAGADLVHATTYLAPRTGRPVVVTLNHYWPAEFAAPESALGARLQDSLARARAVVAASERSRENIERHFPWLAGRLVAVPDGLPERREVAPPSAVLGVRERLGLEGNYALSVGTVIPRKNVDGLVRALGLARALRPGLVLVVVGREDDPSARRVAEGLGLRDAVRFVGPVDDATLSALYGGAALLAQPAWEEGFGLPVLEAAALGVPVVASERTCAREVLGEEAWTVEPGDDASLARILVEVSDGGPRVAARVDRARGRAASWTWEGPARRLAALYRRVATPGVAA
ncbi:MAG: glycosyltransferase family 4 protein [Planctomycetes bacterium]|nr:glycosyltransferase family 4 protein [Planctomycetota bacterium]